jgi:hypothetical protein
MPVVNDDHDDSEPLRLDLGATSNEPSGEPSSGFADRAAGRWRWLLLAAVFLLGVAVSLVVTNVRDATQEQTAVALAVGAQQLRDGDPATLEYTVLNVGPRAVGLVHAVPVGWQLQGPQGEAERSVTAPSGQWATVATAVEPDCDLRPDGTVEVTARLRGNSVRTDAILPPGLYDDLLAIWTQACPARPLVHIDAEVAELTVADNERLVGTVQLEPQGTERSVVITEIDSRTAGFAASSPDLPVELPLGQPTPVTVEWRIVDCDHAFRMINARLEVTVATIEPRAFVLAVDLDESVAMDLARFSGSHCGT